MTNAAGLRAVAFTSSAIAHDLPPSSIGLHASPRRQESPLQSQTNRKKGPYLGTVHWFASTNLCGKHTLLPIGELPS